MWIQVGVEVVKKELCRDVAECSDMSFDNAILPMSLASARSDVYCPIAAPFLEFVTREYCFVITMYDFWWLCIASVLENIR